jgi:hypothetical protein
VVGGGEEEREGEVEGREGGSKRGTRACCVWSCRAATLAAGALVAAAARGMRTEKKVRRVRAERALAPSMRLPLAWLFLSILRWYSKVFCFWDCIQTVRAEI